MANKKYFSGWVTALALLVATSTQAETTELSHRVMPGDSLYALAQRYLESGDLWPVLQRINKVTDPFRLQPGSLIKLPVDLLKRPTLATIARVEGSVVHQGSEANAAPIAVAAGMTVPEGELLKVSDNSFVNIRLADGSEVRVAANSDIEVQRLRNNKAGATQSVLHLNRGKAEAEVQPQKKPRQRFEIRTPIAVTSVRGTRFDVNSLTSGQAAISVQEGLVQVQKNQPQNRSGVATRTGLMLAANEGVPVYANGQIGARRKLLPEPDLSVVPEVFEDISTLGFNLARKTGVAAYQVSIAALDDSRQVLRNSEFTATPNKINGNETGDAMSVPISVPIGVPIRFEQLDDGPYSLIARAIDSDGVLGQVAHRAILIHARPVAPFYQAPAPGARIDTQSGELVCTDLPQVDTYHLQVSSREDFVQPEVDEASLPGCRYRVSTLKPGSYFWRVASVSQYPTAVAGRVQQGPKQGPYAKPQRFILVELPQPPAVSMQDGAETAHLFWSALPGETFHLQLAHDAQFKQILADQWLTQPAWTSDVLDQGDYFVRMQTRTADGLIGDFSPARRLQIRSLIRSADGQSIISGDGLPLTRLQP